MNTELPFSKCSYKCKKAVNAFLNSVSLKRIIGSKGKSIVAVLLGTVVERYDYALYGYMASILSSQFFPNDDPAVALIKHFLVFALGYLAKPLGAYIFGSIGDIYGRKQALRWSIMGIALPTIIIGCLPGYQALGTFSVCILCVCRMAQGIFVSAEQDGVDIFTYESVPKKNVCLTLGFIFISGGLGMALASFAAGLVLLPNLPNWAWRLPFLFGGFLGLITFWLRKYIIESQDYLLHRASNSTPASSFANALAKNKIKLLLCTLLKGLSGGAYHFYFVFWLSYLHKVLKVLPASEACFKASFLMIFSIAVGPVYGYIADRIGVLRLIKIAGLLCIGMIALNAWYLYYFKNAPSMWIMAFTGIALGLFNLPVYVILMQSFKIADRYRCMSTAHAFGSILLTSTAPAIATAIWTYSRNPIAPLFYCCFLLLASIIVSFFIKLEKEPV